jgi:hypothetical protein
MNKAFNTVLCYPNLCHKRIEKLIYASKLTFSLIDGYCYEIIFNIIS